MTNARKSKSLRRIRVMSRRYWRTFSRRMQADARRTAIPDEVVPLTIVIGTVLIIAIWGLVGIVRVAVVVLITGLLLKALQSKIGRPLRFAYALAAFVLFFSIFWNWSSIQVALQKLQDRPWQTQAPKEATSASAPAVVLAPAVQPPQVVHVPVPAPTPQPPPRRQKPHEKWAKAYHGMEEGTYFPPAGTPK